MSVAGVAGTRFDWERLMREVALIMPEGSWLQSADASTAGAAESADGAAPTTGAGGPSATLTGCTPQQSDVARMMGRMRQMHRVTDVTLNSSSQEGTKQPATLDSCGSLYQFDLTVNFSPTEPVSAAPRGEARVPAS